jgi:hypothetical protein
VDVQEATIPIERGSLEDDGVYQGEDRGIDANAERQCKDGDRGKTGAAPQGSKRVPSVLEERLREWPPMLVAVGLLHLIDTPKLASCREAGVNRRHPATDVFSREPVEMHLDLLCEVGIAPPTTKRPPQPG